MTPCCAWCGDPAPKARGRVGKRVFCRRAHKEAYYREALRIGLETLDRADDRLEAAKRASERNSTSSQGVVVEGR